MKRILLSVVDNIAVLVVLSVIAGLLGLDAYLAEHGGSLTGLLETVRAHAQRTGIGMPEVGVSDSITPNAFATGGSRDGARIAARPAIMHPEGDIRGCR